MMMISCTEGQVWEGSCLARPLRVCGQPKVGGDDEEEDDGDDVDNDDDDSTAGVSPPSSNTSTLIALCST
jgi:hypothetical protein